METGYVLLNEVPLFELWQRLRSRLRKGDLPKPIQKMKELMKELMKPRKRKKGQKLKRPIFMTEEQQVVKEWSPSLKTAVEAKDLRRKEFRALGAGEQALFTAFLCNRFPGKKFVCTKCSSGEQVTRGHLQRCKYMHKHVKMLKTAVKLIQK